MKTESGGGGTGADPMAFPHDWHRSLLEDFLDAIEQNREPRISGAEATEGSPLHRQNSAISGLTRCGASSWVKWPVSGTISILAP